MNNEARMSGNPGERWMAIIRRDTLQEFASAFTDDVELALSTAEDPIVGPPAVRHFFGIIRTMYDSIAFVHETTNGKRTYLEWEGEFLGEPVSGVTVLAYDDEGLIRAVQLYHKPFQQVVAFAAGLSRRLWAQ